MGDGRDSRHGSHQPAAGDRKIVEAMRDWKITQAFGSPAIWDRVGQFCKEQGIRLDTIRRVLSAGAPVPVRVLERMKGCIHPEGDIHTPYGATESLPVASTCASEVLKETAAITRTGGGVCVGRRFARVQWKVIRIVDGPIANLEDAEELPPGEIGELIVSGPAVTRRYVTRTEVNAPLYRAGTAAGIASDAGYLDPDGSVPRSACASSAGCERPDVYHSL